MKQENVQKSDSLDMYYTVLAIITFFGPISIYIGLSHYSIEIIAMTWTQVTDQYGPRLMTVLTQPIFFFGVLSVTFPRLIFVYMIYRLYNEKTTRKRAVRVGIISELWFPATYYLPVLLQTIIYHTISSIPVVIPIPLLFIAGLYVLKRRPTMGPPLVWTDSEGSEGWWEMQSKEKRFDSEIEEKRDPIEDL